MNAFAGNGTEERAAAEQAVLLGAAAEKAAAECVSAADATAEKAAEAVHAEYCVTEKVAEESAGAGKAATESATTKKTAESASVRKAAESAAPVLEPDVSDQIASTSSRSREILCCWNCSKEMTPEHQCEVPPPVLPSVKLPEIGKTFSPQSLSPTRTNGRGPPPTNRRRIFPKKFVREAETDVRPKVKCCVCACLGRDTSMVLLGSNCPSCGITATDN